MPDELIKLNVVNEGSAGFPNVITRVEAWAEASATDAADGFSAEGPDAVRVERYAARFGAGNTSMARSARLRRVGLKDIFPLLAASYLATKALRHKGLIR